MNDLISRQAEIDALAEQMPQPYTPDGSHPADKGIFMAQEIYAECIQTLEDLPPAQPEQYLDEWCTDCKEYDKEKHSCPRWNRVIKNTVDELKSAQPEQHIDTDGTLWITVSDIEQVKRVIVDEEKSKFCRQFWMDGDGPASCEDAVSRKAVQCLLAYFVDEDKYVDACDGLKHLPPVTPKQRTGKWIRSGVEGHVICNKCGYEANYTIIERQDKTGKWVSKFGRDIKTNFCPNCGVKMEGDAE